MNCRRPRIAVWTEYLQEIENLCILGSNANG